MPDTSIIIKAIADMHSSFIAGLDKVYIEIKASNKRVTEIETTLEIKKALCKEKKEREKTKKDYWIPIVRYVSIAGILALVALAWEKIVAFWDMLGQ
jgi:hypothetical protein